MCPMCVPTAAMLIAGATSSGRVVALVLRKTRAKQSPPNANPSTSNKEK